MDISKCRGERDGMICPLRQTCYRFTAPSGDYQSYIEPPFVVDGDIIRCLLYWGDEQQSMYNYLKDVVSGRNK